MSDGKFTDKYKGLLSSHKHDWGTPQWLYDLLDEEFHFTVDACAAPYNAKHERYWTEEDDGLSKSWAGETVFMNPPYGKEVVRWVKKAYNEALSGATVVCILRSASSSTKYFKDYMRFGELRFVDHRLKFENMFRLPSEDTSPHATVVVIFTREQILNGPHAKIISRE